MEAFDVGLATGEVVIDSYEFLFMVFLCISEPSEKVLGLGIVEHFK